MSKNEKENLVSKAKGLAGFFELHVEIKLFGHLIWEWYFPPKSMLNA